MRVCKLQLQLAHVRGPLLSIVVLYVSMVFLWWVVGSWVISGYKHRCVNSLVSKINFDPRF